MDYTTLSLADVKSGLDAMARDTQATFGGMNARQLNWRPDETRWSVAQCFEHLLMSNVAMIRAAEDALNERRPRTLWQRLPVVPGVLGRMLIRSQTPGATRKFKASPQAQPAASGIATDIIDRFLAQHHDVVTWLNALDEHRAARTIMTSPFLNVIAYSVLDGCRLIVAHDRRHFEQARQVTLLPGFPRESTVA